MNVASPEWYTSGVFWAIVGTMVAMLGVLAVLWVGLPRQRMLYRALELLPLSVSEMKSGGLERICTKNSLVAPYILTIELACRGRNDIPKESFSDGRPLKLKTGVPVIDILGSDFRPADRPSPKVEKMERDGTAVYVLPGLIDKRGRLTVKALIEGDKVVLGHESSLLNVKVRRRVSDELGLATSYKLKFLATVIIGCFLVVLQGIVLGGADLSTHTSLRVILLMALLVGAFAAGAVFFVLYINAVRLNRDRRG